MLTVALAACSSSGPHSSASQASSSTSASTPGASTTAAGNTAPLATHLSGDLIGTWTSKISDADVSVIQQHAPGFDATGTWTMELSATTFQFLNPSDYSPGSYPVGLDRTNEITVAPELDCPGQTTQAGGQYTYKIDGTSMTLTPVREDSCPFRQWLLISHPWQRKA